MTNITINKRNSKIKDLAFSLGLRSFREGKFDIAARVFELYDSINSPHFGFLGLLPCSETHCNRHSLRGYCYEKLGDKEKANKCYREAAQSCVNKFSAEKRYFEEHNWKLPNYLTPMISDLYHPGMMYLEIGDISSALSCFNQILEYGNRKETRDSHYCFFERLAQDEINKINGETK